MDNKQISLKSFSSADADQIRFARRYVFGTWERFTWRWFPGFDSVVFARDPRGNARNLNGVITGFPWRLLQKFEKLGLAEKTASPGASVIGEFIALNAYGVEFLLRFETDLEQEIALQALWCWDHIQRSKQMPRSGTNPVQRRNSTFGLSETNISAARIGFSSTPAGFLAVAYDEEDKRITDVLIKEPQIEDTALIKGWRTFHANPGSHPHISDSLMQVVKRLADLLKVPSTAIGYDKDVKEDLMGLEYSIFYEPPLPAQ
jgi:hypothetical protein